MSWSWWDDVKWIPYSKSANKIIENAHAAGKSKIDVDDERFVDLKNMLQRRKDDPMKRRNVRREDAISSSSSSEEEIKPMAEMVLLMLGSLSNNLNFINKVYYR
jgi:hypothetical protein